MCVAEKEKPTPLEKLYNKAPIMRKVAWCESRHRQYDESGDPLIGFSGADKGYFQINRVHWQTAREMGINLNTKQGNARFALYLYNKKGTQPWFASEKCCSNVTYADIR
jgi:hypothetical protein